MAERKYASSSRVEINEEQLDVAGGRVSLGEVMAEAQQDKNNGGSGNFFVSFLKNLFKGDDTVKSPLQDTLDGVVDDFNHGPRNA